MHKNAIFGMAMGFLISLGFGSILAGEESQSDSTLLPTVHAHIALQAEVYSNGDSTYMAAIPRLAENGFTVRHALIVVEGKYESSLEYNLEIGTASCMEGGVMIMEAGILYKPHPYWKTGITKGHVLRGFEMHQECVELLTAEKPLFAKKFSPCHPLGGIVEYERDLGEQSGLLMQLIMAEGTGGTFDDEHDINFGVQYQTPIEGLAFAGSLTSWRWNAPYSRKDSIRVPGGSRDEYDVFWVEEKAVYDGYRASIGFDYDARNLMIRGEGYMGKGFKDLLDFPYYADIWADSSNIAKITKAPFEDLEMCAFFIQAGYTLPLVGHQIKYFQPYIQYQWWDQAVNLDGDYKSSFLTVGLNIGLGPGSTRLKVDYQTCLTFAGDGALPGYGEDEQADRLIARLQIGL
jgi:hypothetical protein